MKNKVETDAAEELAANTVSEASTDLSVTATVPRNRWKRSDVFGSQWRLVALTFVEIIVVVTTCTVWCHITETL